MLNLLVVVAGSFLLITGRYPRALFDLLVGINRWLYRTFTYLALMSTAYPPFRLDQGSHEPDLQLAPQPIHDHDAQAQQPHRSDGRSVMTGPAD